MPASLDPAPFISGPLPANSPRFLSEPVRWRERFTLPQLQQKHNNCINADDDDDNNKRLFPFLSGPLPAHSPRFLLAMVRFRGHRAAPGLRRRCWCGGHASVHTPPALSRARSPPLLLRRRACDAPSLLVWRRAVPANFPAHAPPHDPSHVSAQASAQALLPKPPTVPPPMPPPMHSPCLRPFPLTCLRLFPAHASAHSPDPASAFSPGHAHSHASAHSPPKHPPMPFRPRLFQCLGQFPRTRPRLFPPSQRPHPRPCLRPCRPPRFPLMFLAPEHIFTNVLGQPAPRKTSQYTQAIHPGIETGVHTHVQLHVHTPALAPPAQPLLRGRLQSFSILFYTSASGSDTLAALTPPFTPAFAPAFTQMLPPLSSLCCAHVSSPSRSYSTLTRSPSPVSVAASRSKLPSEWPPNFVGSSANSAPWPRRRPFQPAENSVSPLF